MSTEQAEKLAAARNEENAELFDSMEDELIEKAKGSYDDAARAAEDFRRHTGETPEQRAERLWKRRSAACWDDEEGMVQGRQSLPGDAGAEWKAIFDEFVNREFAIKDAGDNRTNAQKRADAAVEMARHARAGLTGTAAERAQVTVLVRYEDLIDDADIVRMVTRGDSQVLDVGRKTRTIPTPTRRAVEQRDGGCTFSGCHCRDGVQVHHIKHWAKLGGTDLANLVCLCWKHHRLVHEGGWTLEMDRDTQRTVWTSPDGRRLIGQRRATAGAQTGSTAAA